MKQTFTCLLLIISLFGNAQNNPADVDLTLGSHFASFTAVDKIATQPDGKFLVGGTYYNNNGRVARFNANGSTDASFQLNSFTHNNSGVLINDLVVQPDGKILVGGLFSAFNGASGQAVNYLIRLNADGTQDASFTPPVFTSGGGIIHDIVLQPDGKIIIGGGFTVQVNGHSQYHACRLNPDGSIDDAFDFGIEGGPRDVANIKTIALQPDGKVLLGGSFTSFNNQSQQNLIRVNSDGSKDTSFDIGTGADTGYTLSNVIVQPDGKIVINGGFQSWNGQAQAHLIRLNSDGSIDDGFQNEFSVDNVGSSSPATISLRADGKILAAGTSFELHGQRHLWLLNSDGSLDSSLSINEDFISHIKTVVELPNGKLLAGGNFVMWSGKMRDCYARLHPDGSLDTSLLSQGLNDEVLTMALQANGNAILGGSFTAFDAVSQNRIIRVNGVEGTKDETFNIGSGFNDAVKIIAVQADGKILVGGDFTQYDGQTANHLIRLNQDGSIDASFEVGTGFNAYVKTMTLQPDGKIIVGGDFTTYNGQPQNHLIRLNQDGTKDSTFEVGNSFDSRITALLLQEDGRILVGGNFITFNGDSQRYLIRLNADGAKDISFTPPQDNEFLGTYTTEDAILDFASTTENIYVVTGHLPRRLNMDGSIDDTFTVPYFNTKSIAIQEDGKVLLGGTFNYFFNNGGYQRGLVQVNDDGSVDEGFDIIYNGNMQFGGFFQDNINETYGCKDLLIQPDGKIWVGGNFFCYRGEESFAAIRLVGTETTVSSVYSEGPEMDRVLIYPNPTQETLTIETENNEKIRSVEIYTLSGQSLLKKTTDGKNVDISTLNEGIYLIKVETDSHHSVSKFVKK